MLCPYCDHSDSRVIDSRDSGDGIRRRRECSECDRRFTTYERVQMRSVMVVKRDGRREEFEREKLFTSLSKACAKRPLPVGSIEKVLDEVEGRVTESGRAEVSSRAVGEMVMEKIKDLDRVAYIRFCQRVPGLQGHQELQRGGRRPASARRAGRRCASGPDPDDPGGHAAVSGRATPEPEAETSTGKPGVRT